MYDRRLDAIVAAAELGSFSAAARRLSISTPALVKQVSGFETEHGLTLFVRSHEGVTLTAAGDELLRSARDIMRASEDALHRARAAQTGANEVRMGVSITSPGRQTLEFWPQVHELVPQLELKTVPVGSLYNPDVVMPNLGRDIDVVQTSFSTARWKGMCGLLHLFDAPFFVDVPRTNPLSGRARIGLDDLAGLRIRILRHANDSMDRLRDALVLQGLAVVVDVDTFDLALFDDAMEKGDAVLTSGGWSGVHPAFVGVPLAWAAKVPTFLAYPLHPQPQVEKFVDAVREVRNRRTGTASHAKYDGGTA